MENQPTPEAPKENTPAPEPVPTLPYATEKSGDDNPPPLYIAGFGVMGQSVPDVATGSTPVTRHDD